MANLWLAHSPIHCHWSEEPMASLLLQSPEERYKELLTGSKNKVIKQVPQQYIVNYVGTTPVSMSRIRKRLTTK